MTQRERILATALVGVAVLGGGGLLAQVALIGPLRELSGEIATVEEENHKKQDELNTIKASNDRAVKLSPRLDQWKQISLPGAKDSRPEELLSHLKSKQVDYEQYLYELLRRNGFSPGSIAVNSRPIEAPRTGLNAAKGPPPVFRALTFTVQGQAALDGVVKMLEEFHRASLLQQVRAINLQKPTDRNAPRGALDLTMTVEALLMVGADKRDELLPPSTTARPQVLAEPGRSYAELASHNIFTGTAPAAARGPTEDARDVLGFVKLTTVSNTNNRRWEAWLFDQSKKDGESRLRTTPGFNEFSYADRYDNVLVRGTVMRIDESGVLFRARGHFYHLGVGDNLYDALREPAEAALPAAGAAVGGAWAAPW